MAMVLQEAFSFNDTIKVNIAYARSDAQDKEIEKAAHAANAHDFIATLPNGYDSIIGERGVKLSGGRNNVLLCPCYPCQSTHPHPGRSHLICGHRDRTTHQNAIYRLVKDRTTFVIAHRLSTILHADLIVVLDKGENR